MTDTDKHPDQEATVKLFRSMGMSEQAAAESAANIVDLAGEVDEIRRQRRYAGNRTAPPAKDAEPGSVDEMRRQRQEANIMYTPEDPDR